MTATAATQIAANGSDLRNGQKETVALDPKSNDARVLSLLYAENITAKVLRVAVENLVENVRASIAFSSSSSKLYPELVPQSGPGVGKYTRRVVDFWTCGFFPGSIWALVDRATKYPQSMRHEDSRLLASLVRERLIELGTKWSQPLHASAARTDTHDLGFMILPSMRPRWELFHDQEALSTILNAAVSLYSRFDPRIGAIRSWDAITWMDDLHIRCKRDNFLVIVDSLCNLELLYYAAAHTGYGYLAEAATAHAATLLRSHLRPERGRKRDGFGGTLYSTIHVVNYAPETGAVRETHTAQGHSPSTTWSRGQAWAVFGYAQVFSWTGRNEFLDAAAGAAEYFLLRLEDAPSCVEVQLNSEAGGGAGAEVSRTLRGGRYVPLWDFDAPVENVDDPLRDASAGLIAANGMLLLTQIMMRRGQPEMADRYLKSALRIVEETLRLCLSEEQCRLEASPHQGVAAVSADPLRGPFQSILRRSTVTWNKSSRSRSGDHGLVYADYYLIEFGNRLLQLGFAPPQPLEAACRSPTWSQRASGPFM
ncbi:unsaturated glucuronyl hydrolase [Colletotrichum musicola]|uniref:Unsaturated glucuronyl hydrolase n=1 Tax=Colletotrichum musicola TaxID=2175873 RepID=A0A8H6IZR2_9PEZI|nr:unsaturated glucuronyl hydrolase [Colletotrichum musicola]